MIDLEAASTVALGVEGITEIDNFGDRNGNSYRDITFQVPTRLRAANLVLALGGQIYDAVAWREKGKFSPMSSRRFESPQGTRIECDSLNGGPETLLAELQ